MDEYKFFERKSSNGGDDNLEKIVFIQWERLRVKGASSLRRKYR